MPDLNQLAAQMGPYGVLIVVGLFFGVRYLLSTFNVKVTPAIPSPAPSPSPSPSPNEQSGTPVLDALLRALREALAKRAAAEGRAVEDVVAEATVNQFGAAAVAEQSKGAK